MHRHRLIATLALSTRKPWSIDKKYFSPSQRPLYLTSMVVAPDRQRQGVGRQCIEEARRLATKWPSDAIRLDAYDADAGAVEFCAKCGFLEVGRASYRKARLIYFEMLL
jgi:GNAT superfamily N-acetyltransferase